MLLTRSPHDTQLYIALSLPDVKKMKSLLFKPALLQTWFFKTM